MIRVATIPLQRTMAAGTASAQRKLADTLLALNSGKKAEDLAGLGSNAGRTLSGRAAMEQQRAASASAGKLGTTLSLYDANISAIDTAGADLRKALMTASGTGQSAGLQNTIESAFAQFRGALNATDGESPLFAGSQTDTRPFAPGSLADTVGATPTTAFKDDAVMASARVAPGEDMTYGIAARDLGSDMLAAFRTLAEAGPIGAQPTPAQQAALQSAIGQIDIALPKVRALNAANGLNQKQADIAETRASDRADLLEGFVSEAEDADYGQIAMDLAQQTSVLQASYSVFSRVSGLSLTNFLR